MSSETAISTMLEAKFEKCRQFVDARVNITQLSLKMLDSLLAYLDPNKWIRTFKIIEN